MTGTREGDSFSCDLGMRASEAIKAIEAFRFGVLHDDAEAINDVLEFPLRAGLWSSGALTPETTIQINNVEEWKKFQPHVDNVFRALIACTSLHNVSIVKSRSYGVMAGSGRIWFQVSASTPKVKVTSINIIPIEAGQLFDWCSK